MSPQHFYIKIGSIARRISRELTRVSMHRICSVTEETTKQIPSPVDGRKYHTPEIDSLTCTPLDYSLLEIALSFVF